MRQNKDGNSVTPIKAALAGLVVPLALILAFLGLFRFGIKAEPVDDTERREPAMKFVKMGGIYEPVNEKEADDEESPRVITFDPDEEDSVSDNKSVSEDAVSENAVSENSVSEDSISENDADEDEEEPVSTGDWDMSTIGPVTPESMTLFNQYLDRLSGFDPSLISSFKRSGWKMTLVADTPYMPPFEGTTAPAGYTSLTQKTIYVAGNGYEYLVQHEMGHYLDHMCGAKAGYAWYSSCPEFISIWTEESPVLGSYSMSDPAEFFAEIYRGMLMTPVETQAACPRAWAFVMACRSMM